MGNDTPRYPLRSFVHCRVRKREAKPETSFANCVCSRIYFAMNKTLIAFREKKNKKGHIQSPRRGSTQNAGL
jgi:hypothetical protein